MSMRIDDPTWTWAAVPHWMRLALPDDVIQVMALARLDAGERASEDVYAQALAYHLRVLRYEVWDRSPRRAPRRPHILRPSKRARRTGWRRNKTRGYRS